MKKAITLFLALVLLLSLSACDVSNELDVQKPSSVEAPGNNGNTENNQNPPDAAQEATVAEAVLVDESGIKITAKKLKPDEIFGAELTLLIENDSGKDLTIQCRNASVNGYMVETMMSVDVLNGKKANDSLTFMTSDLENYGVTDIADMEFSFHVFTTEDWETYLDTTTIRLETSIAETYEYTFDGSGNVAYDKNDIKVVIKGLAEDASIFGPSIVVYIENNTDELFTIQSRDVSINGFMVDAMFSCDVMPGKKAIDTITFMDSDPEENEITNIEDVELSFHVFNTESWEAIVDTDAVKIVF